jgi:hypothetical protein
MARVPIRNRLECVAGPKHEILRQMLSDQPETDRRATLGKAAVHGQRRHPGQIERTCIAQQFGKIAPRHLNPLGGAGQRLVAPEFHCGVPR